MATGKLIGADDAAGGNSAANYFQLEKFTAVATGNITEFRVKSAVSGYVKVALYADNAGSPGTLITAMNTGQAVAGTGWATLSFTSTPVISGTPYWLAMNIDTNGAITEYASGGTGCHKPATYSGFTFPNPAGSGFTSHSWQEQMAGWGVLVLTPSSISQPVSYGTPEVIITSALTIQPLSIVQAVAIGVPALLYPQILLPPSIVQAIVYGTPSVGFVGAYGIIVPQSIIQQISTGSPTILKYVWHLILDGQYNIESPETNRTFVIGRDVYGNPVWGEAHDTTESALVGERLDFQPDPAIPTTAQAADVAAAVLAKMRLTTKRGVILIPYNCGQELWDVVQITDAGANQSAVSFRVVGIRFEYSPKQARYEHRLILGAP